MPTPSKSELIKMIDDLKTKPNDRVRILGDVGITAVGAGLGGAAGGAIATGLGVGSIPLLTTAASWIGVTLAMSTPIGWTIAAVAAGGTLAYGASRLIHSGGISEGRKKELRQAFEEDLLDIEAKERAGTVTDVDKEKINLYLRELIQKDVIMPENAIKFIELIEQGKIPLSLAYSLMQAFLKTPSST